MTSTPQRDALTKRALSENLTVHLNRSSPHIAHVNSLRTPGQFFRVTRATCTCRTFRQGGICKHIALVIHLSDAGLPPFTTRNEDFVNVDHR